MVILAEKHSLLWFGAGAMPPNVLEAVNGQWEIIPCQDVQSLTRNLRGANLALLSLPEATWSDLRQLVGLLDRVDRSGAVAVVLLPEHLLEHDLLARRRGQFIAADAQSSPRDLAMLVRAAAALQPAIRSLRAEVTSARQLGARSPYGMEQLDEEMRLAARIQRDFLPQVLPQVGRVRFAALFRPAGWVSGDLYDVFRLDETHVGFYIADVVGHGLPAALLTMFIKRAIQAKRIEGHAYRIVPPQEVLAQLNDDIWQQNFTSCQFCTAFYGIVDTDSLRVQYARAGHPCPMLLDAQGRMSHLEADGSLLGIFPGQSFAARQRQLAPGDRLVVFSDGLEEAFSRQGAKTCPDALADEIRKLAHLPPEDMILQLTRRIDEALPDSRKDDMTLLVMEVQPQ